MFGMWASGAEVLNAPAQESFPAPPAERALIYTVDRENKLTPLPFEAGTTPLRIETVAGSDKKSYVELKGERAATLIENDSPRFYLFVPDQANVHPPLIVRLTPRRGARRLTAMAQRGQRGFAVASEEIIKPHYRVLARADGMLFMEVRPRQSLLPGEYAIIGSDLARIATFSVVAASNP
ncbi:MAG TPA: hypothetical protein VD966_15055 [Pyrinomonadaceae bacterium]|nr:hypothetical protein [Pyrinomonadaceae bacterium]